MSDTIKFIDKCNEVISIKVEDDYIEAFNSNNKSIGVFHYNVRESIDEFSLIYELYSMNINNEYQKRGIGTKIIELGESFFEKVIYPNPYASRHENHLSSEGLALIESCIEKGIIKNYYEEDEEDDYDFYGEYYE